MAHYNIRLADSGDSAAMCLLTQSLLNFLVQGDEIPSQLVEGFTQTAFAERLSSQSGYYSFVAESAGEVVGFITMRGDDYLFHLFVAKSFHRQGVARRLWQQVTAQSPAEVINLRSSLFAVPTYQKLGFEKSGAEVALGALRFQAMTWQRSRSV